MPGGPFLTHFQSPLTQEAVASTPETYPLYTLTLAADIDAPARDVRDVAASRDLSDEEIRSVLKLKHEEIARFSEVHGVNLKWLFEGEGQIFKSMAPK
jgi:hypothetical protein